MRSACSSVPSPIRPLREVVSREVSLALADADPPPPITDFDLTVSPTGDEVSLDWSNYNPWEVGDVAHYAIYFSPSEFSDVGGMTPYAIIPGETLEAAFIGLPMWQDHFFAVVPVDALGNFEPSVTYSAAYVLMPGVVSREVGLFIGSEPTPPYRETVSREFSIVVASNAIPSPVTGVTSPFSANASHTEYGGIDLDWTHYNPWAEHDVIRYRIYVDSAFFDDVTGMTPHAFSDDGLQTATITGLACEQIFHVAVVAEDALGQFDPAVYSISSKASVCELGDVADVTATPSGGIIVYDWDLGGVGTDLAHFVRQFHLYFDGATTPIVIAPEERSYTITGLVAGQNYTARLTTVDLQGTESLGVVVNTDGDLDQLPDYWELMHGLDPSDDGTSDVDSGPDGDPDGDELSNLFEFLAGFDPTVANPAFRLGGIRTGRNLAHVPGHPRTQLSDPVRR